MGRVISDPLLPRWNKPTKKAKRPPVKPQQVRMSAQMRKNAKEQGDRY